MSHEPIPDWDDGVRAVGAMLPKEPPTPEQQFGISAENVASLRELREHVAKCIETPYWGFSEPAERWLRAFDSVTHGRFK